jgi:hypothetical protein
VGALLPEYDAVQKISIVPRGAAGGLTFFAPNEAQLESGLFRCCACLVRGSVSGRPPQNTEFVSLLLGPVIINCSCGYLHPVVAVVGWSQFLCISFKCSYRQ